MYLDFLSMKHYLQKIVLSFIFITFAVSSSNPSILNIIFFVFGINLLAYPFILEEQNHLDKFYGMLPVRKKDRVRGRYILTLAYGILIAIILSVMNYVMYYLGKTDFSYEEAYLLMGIGYLLYFVLAAVELPILLKWGYAKTRMFIIFLPFLIGFGVPGIIAVVRGSIGKDALMQLTYQITQQIINNRVSIGGACIVVSAFAMLLSYGCAMRTEARG
jgi:hypothetical protein